jgi:hypothetical protein
MQTINGIIMTGLNTKECPYCNYQAEMKQFTSWEEKGKKGLLGKTEEGFIMLLCPSCESSIKFDPLINDFKKNERKSSNGIVVSLTFAAVIAVIIFLLLFKVL